MEPNEVGKTAQKKFLSFLSGRPIWVSWIAYSALSAILFGVFYAAMYFMVMQWWIPIVLIVGTGMVWGTLTFKAKKK